MAKRILLTGGAGFIGSHLVRYLLGLAAGYQVTNLDALTYAGNLDNLADVAENPQFKDRYRFVQGDIRDEALVRRLMGDADVCINVAAQTHVDRSITGPGIFVQTNVGGTQVLLEAARQTGVEKFIQVSTDEVYGSAPEGGFFEETAPLVASSPYSASKAGADLLAISYYKTFGLPVCITRCTNNYGSYQYPEKLIPFFILKAMRNEPLPVYGDGLNIRDWIHVEDHNRAVARVLEAGTPGEVYNIGADNLLSNLDITRQILSLLGKPQDLITYVADRPGHDRRYALNSQKIQTKLGWKPQRHFAQSLQETVQWYQDHPVWVARVQARQQHVQDAPETPPFLPGNWGAGEGIGVVEGVSVALGQDRGPALEKASG